MFNAEHLKLLRDLNRSFMDIVPHNTALGLRLTMLEERFAEMRLPYRADLVGNPVTGVLHGGAISALMDACCGAAVFMSLEKPMPIATLDLRIDYIRPATPHEEVVAEARCFKVTKNVAFVRGVAFHGDREDPVATATATFMIGTQSSRGGGEGHG